jgi:hypothetical protein
MLVRSLSSALPMSIKSLAYTQQRYACCCPDNLAEGILGMLCFTA